jgi:hypothetical protein
LFTFRHKSRFFVIRHSSWSNANLAGENRRRYPDATNLSLIHIAASNS